jgi:hypothetical protein
MKQIQSANKKIGNSDKQKNILFDDIPGIPDDNKQAPCNNNGKKFSKGVKNEIIIATDNK